MTRKLLMAAVTGFVAASSVHAQSFTWQGDHGLWSNNANWNPNGPLPTNATVAVAQNGAYAAVDVDTTIANLTVSNLASVGAITEPAAANKTLNVTGTTNIADNGLIQASDGAHYKLGTLLQQSNATFLHGGAMTAGGGISGSPNQGIVEWRGANVVRNEGSLGYGPNGFFRDQDTGLDALRNFSQNAGLFGVDSTTYTTPNAFTNFGLLSINTVNSTNGFARLTIGGAFANFTPGTGVLNGGGLLIRGINGGRAEFAFPGADIRTLAPFTYITLEGNAAIVDSVSGDNGLRHLGNLGGDFSFANAFGVTPANGVLQQVNGNLYIRTNGHLTVTGDLEQFQAGGIRLDNGASLTISGNSTVAGQFFMPDEYDLIAHANSYSNEWEFEQGSAVQGSGALTGNVMRFLGEIRPGSVPGPGTLDGGGTFTAGRLDLHGLVFMTNETNVSIVLGGPQADTQYSTIRHTDSQMFLGGTLRLVRPEGYVPAPEDRFTIIQSPDLQDDFNNVEGQYLDDANIWLALMYLPDRLIVGQAIPGDATLDGYVDIGDFSLLAAHFNSSPWDWTGGDFNDNLTVELGDFALMAANFNRSLLDQPRGSAVPEPAALAAVAPLFATRSRRR